MLDKKDKKLADKLVFMTLEAGDNAVSELSPALARVLEGRSLGQKCAFTRYFMNVLQRELRKETLVIEHAGPFDDSLVQPLIDAFAAKSPRKLRIEKRETPELIGGLRIRLDDNVYDASIRGRLATLTKIAY
jgi:F-type H+-transporting ATPase subunit delta